MLPPESEPVGKGPVLSGTVLKTRAIAGNAAASPIMSDFVLTAYEPDLRATSAIRRVLKFAATDAEWTRLQVSLSSIFREAPPTSSDVAMNRVDQVLSRALDPNVPLRLPEWAMTGQMVMDLAAALIPWRDKRLAFIGGLLEGLTTGVVDDVAEQIRVLRGALEAIVDFYSLSYDYSVLKQLFLIYLDEPGGDALRQLGIELEREHPEVMQALRALEPLAQLLDHLTRLLQQGATPTDVVLQALSDWMEKLPETVGTAMRGHIEELLRLDGDASAQGEVIGRVVGPVLVQVVLAAVDLAHLARSTVEFLVLKGPTVGRDVLLATRNAVEYVQSVSRRAFPAQELVAAAAHAEKVAPGIVGLGAKVAEGSIRDVVQRYGEFSVAILPNRVQSRRTIAWNAEVRRLTGLEVNDLEYAVSLRLDSGHIVGGKYFDEFPEDFRAVFKDWRVMDADGKIVLHKGKPLVVSWESADDMDAMGIHTERHIRSPDKFAAKHGWFGGEGLKAMEKEMEDFFDTLRLGPDGVSKPFASLRELLVAHREYYQTLDPLRWVLLEDWFERAMAALAKAGR